MHIYGDRIGHEHTGRGLLELGRRLGEGVVEAAIRKRITEDARVRVLEIGCGEGRVLMELRSHFPTADIHGVNKESWPAMQGQQSLSKTAEYYGIPSPDAACESPLPKVHFCEASELPFESEYFDLIFSQACLHFVQRKDRALEEVLRVLRPGGEAHLHIDSPPTNCDRMTPRFRIEGPNGAISLLAHLRERCGSFASFTMTRHGDGRFTTLLCRKVRLGQPNLGLRFDEALSRDAWGRSTPGEPKYGYESVFNYTSD
jgi:SAM-dependent methyltransferase